MSTSDPQYVGTTVLEPSSGAREVTPLLGSAEVRTAWDQSSALPELSTGGLVFTWPALPAAGTGPGRSSAAWREPSRGADHRVLIIEPA